MQCVTYLNTSQTEFNFITLQTAIQGYTFLIDKINGYVSIIISHVQPVYIYIPELGQPLRS